MNTAFKTTIVNKISNLQEIVKNVIRTNQLYKTMGFLEINDLMFKYHCLCYNFHSFCSSIYNNKL